LVSESKKKLCTSQGGVEMQLRRESTFSEDCVTIYCQGRSKGDVINGFILQELPKLDLTTDAEYAANLVNVHATLWFITQIRSTCITAFFLLIS